MILCDNSRRAVNLECNIGSAFIGSSIGHQEEGDHLVEKDPGCTKNYISQVLQYHGKLKSSKSISSFHQRFGSNKDCLSHRRKFKNKNFSVIRKHGIPC